jgi:hypothetical protein
MKQTNYMQTISKANTLEELTQIKESFLSECKKREQTILVSNILGQINDFCGAQAIFESMIVPLMGKKGGKNLINKYTKVIKENKSLKTIYAYNEGLKENKTTDAKKAYITEALSLSAPIHYNEYVKGVGEVVSLISEAFKMLGNDYILENVSYDNKAESIGSSLLYLSTTKKNIRNLNEYISHIDNVSENITESKDVTVNVDLSLDEIVSEMTQKVKNTDVDNIFNTDNKEKTFCEAKNVCLTMIKNQKEQTNDEEISAKLTEMETKLIKKQYTFETFTKDMLYMTELQEVLK